LTEVSANGDYIAHEVDGHDRTVIFDSALRLLTDESASGLTSTNTWDPAGTDELFATENPQGQETTTAYDWQDRPTDAYGPAPVACFSGLPLSPVPTACAAPPAHSSTTYDGGLTHTSYDGNAADTVTGNPNGLNTVYYTGSLPSGAPLAFALGDGGAGGAVTNTWTSMRAYVRRRVFLLNSLAPSPSPAPGFTR
jgi:large repetitive protein